MKALMKLMSRSYKIFTAHHPVEFASAFAYFSLFGLPSIFLIMIVFLRLFFPQDFLFDQLQEQLAGVVGKESSEVMVLITGKYLQQLEQSLWSTVFYSVTFLLLATQLMVFFQDILNGLWQVKPRFDNLFQKQIKERGLTFIMVVLTGMLFFISAAIDWAFEQFTTGILKWLSLVFKVCVIYAWFAILYKHLPFASIQWKSTLVGAAVTTALFFLGLVLLDQFVIQEKRLDDFYDYVAPVVQVSFWIFYTSLAFLFGASFTKAYTEMKGQEIKPKEYAYKFKEVEDRRSKIED
jgi:membrane protein